MTEYRILSALLPLILGILVIKGMIRYSKSSKSSRSISPSYFGSVALLFALFASLIFSEVWTRISKINSLLVSEANDLRGILRISETIPGTTVPFKQAVQNFIALNKEWDQTTLAKYSSLKNKAEDTEFSGTTFRPIYKLVGDSILFKGHALEQQALYEKTDELRSAWFDRKELLKQRVLPEKILILFLMGFFTQLAIAMSHLGNDRAIRDTVFLFSLAFASAILLLALIDDSHFSSHFISHSVLNDIK